MASTLCLDLTFWDLFLDANGNIAVATDPYSVAQDVASACRIFQGDLWYQQSAGIPYFSQVLGKRPPIALIKQYLVQQALTVPGCTNPIVFLSSVSERGITGQVQFTDSNGTQQTVSF